MLNLKKVIALVCVFAMALSTVAFGATYADVPEDSAYYEAVETLTKLGIVEGDDKGYRPEDGVTRAEMAKLIACIQGYGETAKGAANTAFTDVPANHWASGYIANAAGMGIINGYGDGTFGPEDPVLYEQAIKMVMATLGYTPFAEKNGGYPTGYLAAAQRYDVSLVSNPVAGSEANRGTVAQILANALDTPLMIQAKWSTDGTVDYVIADGTVVAGVNYGYKTLMSENLGYVKLRGIVEDTYTTSIAAGKIINTNDKNDIELAITDDYMTENSVYLKDLPTEFLVGDTKIADYLGQSVICYVKKIGNDWTTISVAVDTARNEELVIDLDQYVSHTSPATGDIVTYYRDGANDSTDVSVDANLEVIFNGVGYGVADIDSYITAPCLAGGQIRLIDNDENKGYDVAIIDYASTAVVEEAAEDGIIFLNDVTLANGDIINELAIDADDTTAIAVITKDGEEFDFTTLEKYDVLSLYAADDDLKYVVADVVSNKVVGTIGSMKNSATSAFQPAGYSKAQAYKVADAWYDVATGAWGTADLDIREGGTFYIDEFGKIAAFVEDAALAGATSVNYGYVFGYEIDAADFGGNGVTAKLQMLTGNGLEVLDIKSNALIETASAGVDEELDLTAWTVTGKNVKPASGEGKTEFEVIEDLVNADNDASTADNQVVQYITNADGKITKITCAGFDADFKTKGIDSTSMYNADRNRLETIGYLEDDAIVFVIGTTDTSYVGTVADLEDEVEYDITASYQDKKSTGANVVVTTYASVKTSKTAGVAVVVEAGETYNEADEAVWSITYILDGETFTAETVSDTVALGGSTIPAAGDVIKVKVGSNGVITSLERVWTSVLRADKTDNAAAAYGAYATAANGNATGKEKFYGGIVTAWDKDYKTATLKDAAAATKADVQITRANNVYLVDNTGRTVVVKKASAGNFKYFAKLYDGNVDTITFVDGSILDTTIDPTPTAAEEKNYADQIYVREYDGDITDVIIVKGFVDKVN